MALYAFDDLEDAFALARSFLFPIRIRQWLRLALVALFLGGASGNVPATNFDVGGGDVPATVPRDLAALPADGTLVALAVAVAAVLLLVGLLFALVGSVMEFVLLDSLRSEVRVRRYFRRHFLKGLRLFGFRLLAFALLAAPVVAAVAAFVLGGGPAVGPGRIVAAVLLFVPLFLVLALAAGLLNALTTAFVVPVMLHEDRGVLDAWRRFWPTLRGDWKEYAVYVVVAFVLGAIASTAVGIAVGLVALVVALPLAGVGAAAVAVGGFSPAVWALVGVLVSLFVLLVLAVSAAFRVPVVTYFRFYALLVLGDTNADLDLIPDQRRGVREGEERDDPDDAADSSAY